MDHPLTIEPVKPAGAAHNRDAARDSLLLIATLRSAGGTEHHVRVRNLSSGGMMADSAVELSADERVLIEMRNIGTIGGRVAWSDGERLGVAFDVAIDPKVARKRVGKPAEVPVKRKPIWPSR